MNTLVHRPAQTTTLQRFVFAVVAGLRGTAAAWHHTRRHGNARREMQALDMAAQRYHA